MTEEIKLCDEDYDVVGAILPKDNRDKNILNIDEYTWSTVVNMYVNALDNSYVHQLQWTPLKNMKVLSTDSFYNKYVQDSSIVVLNAFWFKCRSYVMRPDGNVRSVTLVSPLIFLVIECFGRMIYQKHNKNTDTRLKRYYSGNYDDNDPKYRTSYMSYCKDVNHESGFSYYIKTDIKNFYDSISIDLLFDKIIEKTDNDPHLYSFHFFKELLKYAGYGKYPTIDNSVALSYLASMLFLEDVDTDLSSYIQSIPIIKDYKLIRYQDDMYVLFNTHNILSDNELDSICSRIEKHYATTLSNIGLTMNLDKEKHGGANEINLVQINLSYNDSYPAFEGTINENELHEHFNYYLDALEKYDGLINFKTYQDIISSTFIHHAKVGEVQNIERSPNENYNFFVYKYKQSDTEVERLISVVNNHPDLTFLDPKRLFTIAKNTSDENLRQRLFNSLLWPVHNNSDNNEWDAYCLISGIEYLLKTDGMCHKKLRINIKNHNPGVDQFIVHYCNCLSRTIKEDSKESFRIFLTKKPRAFFVYSMLMISKDRKDHLSACAYCFSLKESVNDNLVEHSPLIKDPQQLHNKSPSKSFKDSRNQLYLDVYSNDNDVVLQFQDVRCSILLCHSKVDVKYEYLGPENLMHKIDEIQNILISRITDLYNNNRVELFDIGVKRVKRRTTS